MSGAGQDGKNPTRQGRGGGKSTPRLGFGVGKKWKVRNRGGISKTQLQPSHYHTH